MLNSTAIKYQVETIKAIRYFFQQENFEEVLTPPAVENPGMETHIHPFQLYSAYKKETSPLYLHTSPEFEMKNVLSHIPEYQNIYTLCYCFRDEPQSEIHRQQFLMLEWYRTQITYQQIMIDCEKLISHMADAFPSFKKPDHFERVKVKDIFQEYLHLDVLNFLDSSDLKNKIQKDFKDVPLPESECSWDDYFFLLFLNKIEPKLKNHPYLIIYEYPAPLAALSTLSKDDPRVCERFELYLNGLEVANCFNELTNHDEQVERFAKQGKEKSKLYEYSLPEPKEFLNSLQAGYPVSAGIALGVERLIQGLSGDQNIFFR